MSIMGLRLAWLKRSPPILPQFGNSVGVFTTSGRCVPANRSEERRVGKECRSRWLAPQAEDGIRDWSVTGVQTCALPIFGRRQSRRDHVWATKGGTWIGEVVHVDNGIAVGLVEAVAAHIAPIRQ